MWRRCLKETIYYLPQRNWEHTNYAWETDTDVRVELSSYSTPSTAASTSSSPGTRLTRREALSLIRRRENCWKRWRTSFCSSLPGDVLMLRRGSQRLHQVHAAQVLLRGIQRLVWHGKMEGSFGLDERWVSVLAIPMVQKNKKFWVKSYIYWRMAGRLLQ